MNKENCALKLVDEIILCPDIPLWDKNKEKLFMELFTTKYLYSLRSLTSFMCTTIINPL